MTIKLVEQNKLQRLLNPSILVIVQNLQNSISNLIN